MWHSRLRSWRGHCSGSGCCCGADSIPDPGNFIRRGCSKKKKKQKKKKKNEVCSFYKLNIPVITQLKKQHHQLPQKLLSGPVLFLPPLRITTLLKLIFGILSLFICRGSFLFVCFRTALEAYGGSQARGRITVVAAGHSHSHSHSNTRSEP